jgi:hypothetical protein
MPNQATNLHLIKRLIFLEKNFFYALFAIFLWVLRIPLTIPSLSADRGVYVSSAERLLAGDRLYAEIFEAKDPIFIWQIAFGRFFSPIMDIVLENFWIFLASCSIYWLSRFFKLSNHISIFLGFIVSPVILTGINYYPGYSHLPGIAVVFLTIVFLTKKSYFCAGFASALLFFLKIMLLPIVFFLILYVQVLHGNHRSFSKLALGATTGALIPFSILYLRGELYSYLDILSFNRTVSTENMYIKWPSPIAHFLMTRTLSSVFLICIVLLILFCTLLHLLNTKNVNSDITYFDKLDLWFYTLISLILSLSIIMITGMWQHHNQILAIPAILSLMILAQIFESLVKKKSLIIISVSILLTIGFTGLKSTYLFPSFKSAQVSISKLSSLSPEARALLALGKTGNYARIGTNDDYGHAYGLREWKLVCRVYQIYPIYPKAMEPYLKETLNCLPNAQVIILSPDAQKWLSLVVKYHGYMKEFIDQVNIILKNKYDCRIIFGISRCVIRN